MELLTNLAASYTTTRSTTSGVGSDVFAVLAIVFGYGFLILFIFAIYYVVTAILMGSLFRKAGVKSSTAWIPFYRQYTFLQLGGQNGKMIFLSIGAIAVYLISGILIAVSAGTASATMLPLAILIISLAGVAHVIYYIFKIIASYNITKKLDKDPVVTLFFVTSEFIWWAVIVADKNAKFNDKLGAKRLDK